jgi:thiosulfate reductase cytochrome b subunit
MLENKLYLYPVFIRLWHLLNAVLCLVLIITGISMQFSNPKYPLIRFDIAVSVHNIAGILISFNYLIFLMGNIFTHNGRYYKIPLKSFFKNLRLQFFFYLTGIFRHEKAPFPTSKDRKFNPLQQFAYLLIMYFLFPIIIITGISMMYPDIFIPTLFLGMSALHLTDLFHIAIGFIISLFLFIHVYFCTIGKTATSTFMNIITGYHEVHD